MFNTDHCIKTEEDYRRIMAMAKSRPLISRRYLADEFKNSKDGEKRAA